MFTTGMLQAFRIKIGEECGLYDDQIINGLANEIWYLLHMRGDCGHLLNYVVELNALFSGARGCTQ